MFLVLAACTPDAEVGETGARVVYDSDLEWTVLDYVCDGDPVVQPEWPAARAPVLATHARHLADEDVWIVADATLYATNGGDLADGCTEEQDYGRLTVAYLAE